MARAFPFAFLLVLTGMAVIIPSGSGILMAHSAAGDQCQRSTEASGGGLGTGLFGQGTMGRTGTDRIVSAMVPPGSLLSEAIARMLDCPEQNRAATATEGAIDEASRRGAAGVGASRTWRSETRPGVTGSSTVTAVEPDAQDGDCMMVTDVVIIDGEETRAPKRMCRRPPSNRYARVA